MAEAFVRRTSFNLVIEILMVDRPAMLAVVMTRIHYRCFNLVIEILMVDRQLTPAQNRSWSFNLVIEILMVDRQDPQSDDMKDCEGSFNLVIEILMVDRHVEVNRSPR